MINGLTDALSVLLLVGVIAVYLSSMAGRLDRIHHRIETAAAALDAQLLRRSLLASDLAESGLLDPASSLLLLDAARQAIAVESVDAAARSSGESNLTAVLAEVFSRPSDGSDVLPDNTGSLDAEDLELLEELASCCRRVELARRFHNDAVGSARELRRRRLVRWFHLAGRTSLPHTVEMADTPPPGLART